MDRFVFSSRYHLERQLTYVNQLDYHSWSLVTGRTAIVSETLVVIYTMHVIPKLGKPIAIEFMISNSKQSIGMDAILVACQGNNDCSLPSKYLHDNLFT